MSEDTTARLRTDPRIANLCHHRELARRNPRTLPDSFVRIERRTRWGNPFRMGPDGSRHEVIAKYRVWLWKEIETGRVALTDLAPLSGKTLLC